MDAVRYGFDGTLGGVVQTVTIEMGDVEESQTYL